ncbi:glycosyl hydrolase family 15, partial [Mycobacterium tuberculosis]
RKEGDDGGGARSGTKHPPPQTDDEAADKRGQTTEGGRQGSNSGNGPDHPGRADRQRSARTRKGGTDAPTGARRAASTTARPETPRGERNGDDREAG